MLILSRKVGESLLIDGKIEVKITEISGDRVKIGIDAPRDCRIIRKELRQTEESNREAAEIMASAADLRSLFASLGGGLLPKAQPEAPETEDGPEPPSPKAGEE